MDKNDARLLEWRQQCQDRHLAIGEDDGQFDIIVQSRGVAGSAVGHFIRHDLRDFSNALTGVDRTVKREACLPFCVHPEIFVRIRPLNARGDYHVDGCAAISARRDREEVTHVVKFLFEMDLSHMPMAARQVAAAIGNA